jgi:hypothetical protein
MPRQTFRGAGVVYKTILIATEGPSLTKLL